MVEQLLSLICELCFCCCGQGPHLLYQPCYDVGPDIFTYTLAQPRIPVIFLGLA